MKYFFAFALIISMILNGYGQSLLQIDFDDDIDNAIVETDEDGNRIFFLKTENAYYSGTEYMFVVSNGTDIIKTESFMSKEDFLGSQIQDSVVYYYFVEKNRKEFVLSALVINKFKEGSFFVNDIAKVYHPIITTFSEDNFYLISFDEANNNIVCISIDGQHVVYEKYFYNKMPFFDKHISRANPVYPIENGLPVSTFESSFINKVYKTDRKLIFTFDMFIERFDTPFRYGNATEILELDMLSGETDYYIIRGTEGNEVLYYNSFVLDSTLYRISTAHEKVHISVFDLATRSLISESSITEEDEIDKIASLHYFREGRKNALEYTEVNDAERLVKILKKGIPSISAFHLDDQTIQLTIGKYYDEKTFYVPIPGPYLIAELAVGALAIAVVALNEGPGLSNYFYSYYSEGAFSVIPDTTKTFCQKVDSLEIAFNQNKDKMKSKKYFRDFDRIHFIYQGAKDQKVNVIDPNQ